VKPPPSATTPSTSLSATAELLGYLALLPFVACLAAMGLLPDYAQREMAQHLAIGWGTATLGFMGGVHWGLALAGRLSWSAMRLAGAVAPAIIGAAAILLGGQRGLGLLVVGFGVFWLYEHRNVATELPEDYLRLRRNLSVAACALLALIMILSESVGLT
jgi:hypothetical protein